MTNEYLREKEKEYVKMVEDKHCLLTVFVLSSNRCRYLRETLESIVKQTYGQFIMVILDNCSDDGTEKMVKSINDDRILFISRKSVPRDWNGPYAMRVCKTKYFLCIHDDDLYEPDFIEKSITEMEDNDYDLVSVRNKLIDSSGKIIGISPQRGKKNIWEKDEYFLQYFSPDIDGIMYPSVMYRNSFIQSHINEISNVFEKYCIPASDTLLLFTLGRLGAKMCKLDDYLLLYRYHENQDSKKNDGILYMELFDALLEDTFFSSVLKERMEVLCKRINDCYYKMMRNYYKSVISLERFKCFFDYKCIRFISESAKGKMLLCKLKLRFYLIDINQLFPKYKR